MAAGGSCLRARSCMGNQLKTQALKLSTPNQRTVLDSSTKTPQNAPA